MVHEDSSREEAGMSSAGPCWRADGRWSWEPLRGSNPALVRRGCTQDDMGRGPSAAPLQAVPSSCIPTLLGFSSLTLRQEPVIHEVPKGTGMSTNGSC